MSTPICPICNKELNFFKGASDNGGGQSRPYVTCNCGFHFYPKNDVTFSYRGDGWGRMNCEHEADRQEIIRRFSPKCAPDPQFELNGLRKDRERLYWLISEEASIKFFRGGYLISFRGKEYCGETAFAAIDAAMKDCS